MHPAIQVCLRHNGAVVLNRAIGHGWGNGPADPPDAEKVPVTTETPFCVYSAAKAITTTVVHMLVERGAFSLDDRVCDYLPDLHQPRQGPHHHPARDDPQRRRPVRHRSAAGPQADERQRVRPRASSASCKPIHRPGLDAHLPRADVGPADPRDRLGRHRAQHPRHPGRRDPRPARLPVDELRCGRTGCAAGGAQPRHRQAAARADRQGVQAPPSAARWQQIIPFTNTPLFLTGVVPSSSTVSTADELSRFAEILRRGGELDGVRVMRPETLRAATPECRRLRPDVATGLVPMRWGTGYMLGSKRFGPFGRNAPAAFGHTGLTNIAVWADPERRLSVGVISSGKPGGTRRRAATPPCWTGSPPRSRARRVNCGRPVHGANVGPWVTRCCSSNSTRCARCCSGHGNSSARIPLRHRTRSPVRTRSA